MEWKIKNEGCKSTKEGVINSFLKKIPNKIEGQKNSLQFMKKQRGVELVEHITKQT